VNKMRQNKDLEGLFDRSLSDSAQALPDSVAGQFVFRIAPKSWRPFLQLARIDRPIGWWLLTLPCWWSSALASVSQGQPLHGGDFLLFAGRRHRHARRGLHL
jgi:4-hydroxybenzoate polyprenyltransferase